jgi:hypothetical protein
MRFMQIVLLPVLLSTACLSQDLNEEYNRAELDTIGVFYIPTKEAELEELLTNMLQFDLLARGCSTFGR